MEEECTMCYSTNILYPMDCCGNHTYCLLCIKGLCYSVSPTSKVQCPACRGVAKRKYIKTVCESPEKIKQINIRNLIDNLILNRDTLWIYEGRNNGWWYYDKELQDILESAHLVGDTTISWVICGQAVTLDLHSMTQLNVENKAIRNIKRIEKTHIYQYLIKGIAGMR